MNLQMVHVGAGVGVNSVHETSSASHLNPGLTHSVPTAVMNAVDMECITPGLPRMYMRNRLNIVVQPV